MNPKNLMLALVAVVIAIGAFLYVKDSEYRKLHGNVTQVTLFNWEQEVEDSKDAKPVLVYFYIQDNNSPSATTAQDEVVREFAWDNAGDVKVVSTNCGQFENMVLALGHGAVRFPAFVVIYKGKVYQGTAGAPSTQADLERLLKSATANK